MRIDLTKPIELVDGAGNVFASTEVSGEGIMKGRVWNLHVTRSATNRITCYYGIGNCMFLSFRISNGERLSDPEYRTEFQLYDFDGISIRNKPEEPDLSVEDIHGMSASQFEEAFDNGKFEGIGGVYSFIGNFAFQFAIPDGRGYSYYMSFDKGVEDFVDNFIITAGCNRWFSFDCVRNHYDEDYDSDGDVEEIHQIIDTLERFYKEALASKGMSEKLLTDWEKIKNNGMTPTTIDVSEGGYSYFMKVTFKSCRHSMAIHVDRDKDRIPDPLWFTKEDLIRFRDLINDGIRDLYGNDYV